MIEKEHQTAHGLRKQETLVDRLHTAAYSPAYAPPAVFANLCGEAADELRLARKAFTSLVRAIEAEGYDVMVWTEPGVLTVQRREDRGDD